MYLNLVVSFSRTNLIILITSYVGLLNGIQRYLLPIALVTYGWSIQDYGTVYFIQAFAMAIPLILGGFSTDLKGRKSTITFSFVAFTLGVGIFSYVINGTSLFYLVIAQVITTVSFGITRMALSIQMVDETNEGIERTSSLGLQAGARQIAGFIGPLVFGYIFDTYQLSWFGFNDFQVGFAILAVMGCLGFLLSFLLPETDLSFLEENREAELKDITEDEKKMQMSFGAEELILGFTSGLIVPFINYYILTQFTPTNFQWGLLKGTGSIAVGLGSIIASRYADGFGKGKTVIMFNSIVPILALGIAFAPTLAWVSIFYIARIMSANLIHPIWQSWYYTHISRNLRGRTMSFVQVGRRVSRAFGTASGPMAFLLMGPIIFPLGCLFYPIAMTIPYITEKTVRSNSD